jgi:hypothetical protein
MAITQAMCTSFKAELMLADHNFNSAGGDTFKIALYKSDADLDANTTAYTSTNEASGTNYTGGGEDLTNTGVGSTPINANTGTGFTDFTDATFTNVNVTARGALIYNSTSSINTNAAVCVLDFGSDKTATDGDFVVIFPTNDASNAIIRIA